MPNLSPQAYPLEVPLDDDYCGGAIVKYEREGRSPAIHFMTREGRWGRVTFERLDSLKISRGEHDPFPLAPGAPDGIYWVHTISNSPWLRERYEYEKLHYGNAYNFGGNVDEMLDEFSHYVFSFHDDFVEAIAAGIWFEADDEMLGDRDLDPTHPFRGLAAVPPTERFESSGITCFVRRNPLPMAEIESAARLCSQSLLEIGAELGGTPHVSWQLTRRVLNGVGKTYFRDYFGNAVEVFEHVPAISVLRPRLDHWLAEVSERRRQMGKQ